MIKQLKYLFLLLAFLCIYSSCSTVHYAYPYIQLLSEQELKARNYENKGQYEEAIEIYRQQIENYPNQFKIVLYQHKIMSDTEPLSDPSLLADEIERTMTLFTRAIDEQFDGASPEAVKREHDALEEYVREQSQNYYLLWQKTSLQNNADIALRINQLYTQYFSDSDYYCSALNNQAVIEYRYANIIAFWNKREENLKYDLEKLQSAMNDYRQVVETCEGKLAINPNDYLDAAKGVTILLKRYIEHARDAENADPEFCPEVVYISESTLDEFEWDGQEKSIANCRLDFINASRKYMDLAQKYHDEKNIQSASFMIAQSAEIYFNHYHFNEAISLFNEVIQKTPQYDDTVVYAAKYILESYRIQKKYKEMLDAIHEFKSNTKFMSIPSGYLSSMSRFIKLMDEYEEALNEKLNVNESDK